MKTIGILGGMSAASTQIYYRTLCDATRARRGGLSSPDLLIRSLDFAPIAALQAEGRWTEAGVILSRAARALEAGGAEMLMLATNTMHILADEMMAGVTIPLVHIADATAEAITRAGFRKPGLMATAFTMEKSFYTDRLRAAGLSPLTPDAPDRGEVHRIIYEELCRDVIREDSRAVYEAIAGRLAAAGADSLILGCTEVCMLLNVQNAGLPVFDTVTIHCERALDIALAD